MFALSKDEDQLDDIDDSLTPYNRPQDPSSEFASSYKFQEIDSKGDSRQRWRNNARSLFIPNS
jgi:hypothetical protein